jgi:hypothetical protein
MSRLLLIPALIPAIALTGCGYLTRDLTLEHADPNLWSADNSHHFVDVKYPCDESKHAAIKANNIVAREIQQYFFLFVIPVGSATVLDRPYDGFKFHVSIPGREFCNSEDILLGINGRKMLPDKAAKTTQNLSACEYVWHLPQNENGRFTLEIQETSQCHAPAVEFKYDTTFAYKIDGL